VVAQRCCRELLPAEHISFPEQLLAYPTFGLFAASARLQFRRQLPRPAAASRAYPALTVPSRKLLKALDFKISIESPSKALIQPAVGSTRIEYTSPENPEQPDVPAQSSRNPAIKAIAIDARSACALLISGATVSI